MDTRLQLLADLLALMAHTLNYAYVVVRRIRLSCVESISVSLSPPPISRNTNQRNQMISPYMRVNWVETFPDQPYSMEIFLQGEARGNGKIPTAN